MAPKTPSDSRWVHEIKFDGYRLQIHLKAGQATFFTRRGYDWTPRFKALLEPIWHLPCHQVVLDGEIIGPTADGNSDFGALEADISKGKSERMLFYAFDLLHIDGFDLRACTLVDRKTVLKTLLEKMKAPILYSEHLVADGPTIFRDACRLKLEGIVSKRADGRYISGRSSNWSKVTCRKRDTFVVAGISYKGTKFDGVYLGREEDGALIYAGKVENGISTEQQRDLIRRAKPLLTPRQMLKPPVKKPKAQWLKPKILVDVEYRALTGDGKLRHPSFKGVREDL